EHRAAHAVEVAGDDVEDVDQPARERAELLRARADAAVDRGALGGSELARHAPDLAGRDSGCLGDALGLEVRDELAHLVEPRNEWVSLQEGDKALGEDHVRKRRQQQRVGARADEVMLVRMLCGPAAARVDDYDLAAALAE